MRDRKEIEIEYADALQSGNGEQQNRCFLEALLDIRDQGQPVEVIVEVQPLTRDRVVLSVGYTYFLLSNTMTAQDVTTLIRFFTEVQMTDFQFNVLTDERPKVEITLVPPDKIKMPVDPDAIVPFTQAEVTRDDSDHCPYCAAILPPDSYVDSSGPTDLKFCDYQHAKAYRANQERELSKLTRHAFQPMEEDEEFCGVDGCHLSANDEVHDVL